MKYWLFSCILLLSFFTSSWAEDGSSSSKETIALQILVVDGNTEEPIPAAKVMIKGQASETFTDLDGMVKFESLLSGEYDIEVSFISYEKYSLKDLKLDKTNSQLFVKLYP
jgi:hypothetical protein